MVLTYCGFAATLAGKGIQAIDYLERSLSINPNNSFSQFVYGAALLFSGRLEAGIVQSQFFIDRFPKDPYISLAFYYLACAYLAMDEPRPAEQAIRNCIKHSPDYPWAHLILSLILQAQNRREEVESEMSIVHKLEPAWTMKQIEDIFRHVFEIPEHSKVYCALLHQAWQE